MKYDLRMEELKLIKLSRTDQFYGYQDSTAIRQFSRPSAFKQPLLSKSKHKVLLNDRISDQKNSGAQSIQLKAINQGICTVFNICCIMSSGPIFSASAS